jgi:hypothetical protein
LIDDAYHVAGSDIYHVWIDKCVVPVSDCAFGLYPLDKLVDSN